MEGTNKKLIILGAGESGVGAAILGKKEGWNVFVSDFGKIKPEHQEELNQLNVKWEDQKHSIERILQADLVIKSPGIPEKAGIIQSLREKGVKIISEIEFAGYYNQAKTIAITGSNGKTTTTMLTYHILKKAGLNVGLAGNVGTSLARQVAENNFDWYVLELSSFQLDDMYEFKADIAMILNITPDHLDRYNYEFQNYVNAKFRIAQNQTTNEYLIYNAEDPVILAEIEKRKLPMQLIPFAMEIPSDNGAYTENKQLIINTKDQFTMSIYDLALKGKHNVQNSLASGIAAKIVGIRNESLRDSLGDFVNVEHRLEFVAKVHGIEFINDSKGTNVNSTWFALESMDKPTVWIVGGVDKGNNYDELKALVQEKVKAIICLGKDNQKIIDYFSGMIDTIVEAGSAQEAVNYGYQLAQKGDTVLLSPACASFDLFENYEDRGNQFKEAVRSL